MKKLYHSLIVCLTLVMTVLVSVRGAAATTATVGNGFQISPVRSEITINKGQSQTVEVTVDNPTSVQITAQAVVDDFEASSDESGSPKVLLNGQVADPSHNFISLVGKLPPVTIPADGSVVVPVTVSVPSSANAGGYYGVVRFVPTSTTSTGNVGLTASVGTIFLITVPGNLVEKLDLVQLSAASSNGNAVGFFTSGQPHVLTRLQNVGDIHLQPFGTINIKDMSGKIIYSYQFNDTSPRANILPDSTRKFVDSLPNRHWFGHYTIQANIAYASGSGTVISSSVGFWYLPVWFVILLIVAIVLLIGVIYWLILHRRRHHKKPSKKVEALR